MGRKSDEQAVFINCPFDKAYQETFIALVGSLVAVGLKPRSSLEIGMTEQARVDKIRDIIHECGCSVHDLSLMKSARLNMPFELGIAFELSKGSDHIFALFETQKYRHLRTLSDLSGHDAFIHGGRRKGVVQAVLDFISSSDPRVTYKNAYSVAEELIVVTEMLLKRERRANVFNSHIFPKLVSEAAVIAKRLKIIE